MNACDREPSRMSEPNVERGKGRIEERDEFLRSTTVTRSRQRYPWPRWISGGKRRNAHGRFSPPLRLYALSAVNVELYGEMNCGAEVTSALNAEKYEGRGWRTRSRSLTLIVSSRGTASKSGRDTTSHFHRELLRERTSR